MLPKRLLFLTGTRADFGKLKPLMDCTIASENFDVHIFVTGMHMMSRYGYTCDEIEKSGYKNIHKFINQNSGDTMDSVLGKTVTGLSDFVKEVSPQMIIVHGDRVETLAGAIVGSLSNILVAHLEGGEVSGTIDELIRHAVTKLSHLHFVANELAARRLQQLGEKPEYIYAIGSPDIDVMNSKSLPSIGDVRERYNIEFDDYGIVLFHPVTTEVDQLAMHSGALVDALLEDGGNYVVIFPNNDHGTELIMREYARFEHEKKNFRMFPSMRFEYFLTLLKHAEVIVGNSSAGIREAPFYGVPTVNIGTRQFRRAAAETILNCSPGKDDIVSAIGRARALPRTKLALFGSGNSASQFLKILAQDSVWSAPKQKQFVDMTD